MSLTRSIKRKKELGEVFTPPELVKKMLDELPPEIWSDPSKRVGDITGCGNGNFLVEVIKRKIENGSTPLQALSKTVGIEIMQDNVEECRERLLKQAEESSKQKRTKLWSMIVLHNIICADALTFDHNTLGFGNYIFEKAIEGNTVIMFGDGTPPPSRFNDLFYKHYHTENFLDAINEVVLKQMRKR